jgi:hypothetical protein
MPAIELKALAGISLQQRKISEAKEKRKR